MDAILSIFISWQFLFFCFAIVAIVFVIRTIIEYILISKNKLNSNIWNNLILPLLPIFVGFILSLHDKTFPYPNLLITVGGRTIFGLVAGLLSSSLYRLLKAIIKNKTGINIDSVTNQIGQVIQSPTVTPATNTPIINQPIQATVVNQINTSVDPNNPDFLNSLNNTIVK